MSKGKRAIKKSEAAGSRKAKIKAIHKLRRTKPQQEKP